MKAALVMSAVGLAALTAVMGSAASHEKAAPIPTTTRPTPPPWKADIDRMLDKGCIFVGIEHIPEEEGGGGYAQFMCPNETPSPLRPAMGRM